LIDKENEVFKAVSTALRKHFKGIYVIGAEMSSAPPKFPAVSFVQTNSAVKTEHSTFDSLENVVTEDYKAEVYSNLEKGKEAQTKEITSIISEVMSALGYGRTFCEVVPNADATINRRMSRYRKNNVI
jgi:restriction endonuclease Mrr